MELTRTTLAILSAELICIVLAIVLGYMAISEGLISQLTSLVLFALVLLFCQFFERHYVDWS